CQPPTGSRRRGGCEGAAGGVEGGRGTPHPGRPTPRHPLGSTRRFRFRGHTMRRSRGRALGVRGLLVPVVGSAEVFINELHYDNAGADVGEAVEVVATAGEDLSQYSLYFYNGSTGGLSTATSPNPQAIGAGATVS